MNKAVFLDRDGVVNKRAQLGKYVLSQSDFHLLPGVLEALKYAKSKGYLTVLITNQSCVGRGLISEKDLAALHKHLQKLLTEKGVCFLDAVYFCPHLPTEGCACRKPKPGMLLKASKELGIDLAQSIFVGDFETDLLAGKAANCPTYIIKPEENLSTCLGKLI